MSKWRSAAFRRSSVSWSWGMGWMMACNSCGVTEVMAEYSGRKLVFCNQWNSMAIRVFRFGNWNLEVDAVSESVSVCAVRKGG